MLTVKDIADYFIHLGVVDEDYITHLKVQKLVYYAQGFHLAMFGGKPLFNEPIEAWEHGPVCPALYSVLQDKKAAPITETLNTYDSTKYSGKVKDLLDEVYKVYGQFSAWKLRNLTHEEAPWSDTPRNTIISNKAMTKFFKTLLVNDDE